MTGHRPKPELMAPAGGPEAAFAAFHHGADAVYLGLRRFSARADAENFGAEDLEAVVAFAHAQTPRRRVYAALNTLILQAELPAAAADLGLLADLGADAVIVQDLGVARLARQRFPALRLHASTQLAVHNRAGVEALRRLGFARATLARELTLDEIRDAASVPGIETEAFVHGALCYCYSGLCLFSSMATGRSGNRGRCAYACRDAFSAPAGRPPAGRFAFSMKDLALGDAIPRLAGSGVASLKIEGRKKSPLYVGAVTAYYRRLLDGGLSPEARRAAEADIQSVFSRPWTRLFVDSRRSRDLVDASTVGHRGTPAGRVEGVTGGARGERRLRFQTARALELHDGLQVDLPGVDRPFGFPVDRLLVAGRPVFEAPAGAVVEVGLPADAPNLPAGAPVYCSSSQAVKRAYRFDTPPRARLRVRHPMDIRVRVAAEGAHAEACADGPAGGSDRVEAEAACAGLFGPAREPGAMVRALRESFDKLGGTRWSCRKLDVENPGNLFIPVSALNALRRDLAGRLEDTWRTAVAARDAAAADEAARGPEDAGAPAGTRPRWSLKTDDPRALAGFVCEDEDENDDEDEVEEFIVEIGLLPAEEEQAALARLAESWGAGRVRLALPMITRAWERAGLEARIRSLWDAGWRRWQAANLSALSLLPAEGLDLSADWPLYAVNAGAIHAGREAGFTSFTFSPEDGLPNLKALLPRFGGRGAVVVYQDTPLFVSETCVRLTRTGHCPGEARCDFTQDELTSSHGDRILAVNRRCRTWVIGERPLCWAGHLDELASAGARRFRADFMLRAYTPERLREIWRALRAGRAPPSIAGNYRRGLA